MAAPIILVVDGGLRKKGLITVPPAEPRQRSRIAGATLDKRRSIWYNSSMNTVLDRLVGWRLSAIDYVIAIADAVIQTRQSHQLHKRRSK